MAYEDQYSDILEHDPKSRAGTKWLTPADLLARALAVVLKGGTPSDVQRKLRISLAHAARLHKEAWAQAWQGVDDEFTEDVKKVLKKEQIQRLSRRIAICDRAVELSRRGDDGKERPANTRPYTPANAATKLLIGMMPGWNAPTTSVSLELTETSLVHSGSQLAFLDEDPEIQEHVLAINARRRALALASGGDGPGGLRDHGQRGPVEALAPPGAHQPPAGQGGLGPVPQADGLRPAPPREIGVRFEVLPGVVPGDLPGSEGPDGQP